MLEQRRKSDEQHSCRAKGAMPRRVAGGPGAQVLLGVAVVGLFLYGFYSYHGVKTGLRLTEESMDRLKTRHESLAAQMQVVYEHKVRLEKSILEEQELHKKTKDEFTMEKKSLEEQMQQVKNTFNEELIKTKKEHSELEGTLSDELHKLQSEYNKLQENCQSVENLKQTLQIELKAFHEQCQQDTERLNQQSNQLKQQCLNDIAQLKDGIADLSRRNTLLQMKLQNVSSPNIANMTALDNVQNKSLIEDQNVMQIDEPGRNKQKAYFEVKSPLPDSQQMVDAGQLPLAQAGQMVQPMIKSQNPEMGDSNNRTGIVSPTGGVGGGGGGVGGEGIGADAGNVPDNQIRDDVVNRSYTVLDNAVDRLQQGSPEGVIQEGNPVPVQIPAPAQRELGDANSQSGVLDQPVPSNSTGQVLEPEEDSMRSHSVLPEQMLNSVQTTPNTNVTVEADDEIQLNQVAE